MSNIKEQDYKVYGYRWVVLIMYALAALMIQLLWATFFSITTEAGAFYGFTDAVAGANAISLLSILFMVGMIVFSIPSLVAFEKFGYRKSVGFGVAIMAVAALLRGIFGDSYGMLVFCTVLFALAQPFILNSVGLVAGKWFPAGERATANGIGLLASYVGMICGLLFTPVFLEAGLDIKAMLLVYGIIGAVIGALFLIFTREAPPTPPCPEEESARSGFGEGIKAIFKKPSFIFILIAFFITLGVFNTFFTLIEPILHSFSEGAVDSIQIGLIGVIILVIGIIGSVILPVLSDKSKSQKRKPFVVVCHILGAVGLALFMLMSDFNGMVIAAGVYGLFAVGIAPIVLTFSAEVSYPVSEGTSEGLLMFAGNVGGVIFLGLAGIFGSSYLPLMITLSVLMLVAWFMYISAKETKLKKDIVEEK